LRVQLPNESWNQPKLLFEKPYIYAKRKIARSSERAFAIQSTYGLGRSCGTIVRVARRVVARDGIEPPTPAFSGPRSTTELSGLGVKFQGIWKESAALGQRRLY